MEEPLRKVAAARAAVDRSAAAESLLRFEQELGLILKILALDYPSGFQWFHRFSF